MSTGIPTLRRNEPIIARKPAPAAPATVRKAPDPHGVQLRALNDWRTNRTHVQILTANRDYRGVIEMFDQYTIRLDGGMLIFKHAIESIAPAVTP